MRDMETTAGAGEPDVEESAMLQPKKRKNAVCHSRACGGGGIPTVWARGRTSSSCRFAAGGGCHTIAALKRAMIDEIVLVCREEDRERSAD